MAKKQVMGKKDKNGAKGIAAVIATGAVVSFVGGYSLISQLIERHNQGNNLDKPVVNGTQAEDVVVKEPAIEMDTTYETGVETEATLPELQQPIIPDQNPSNPSENISVDFAKILSQISNIIKNKLAETYGSNADVKVQECFYSIEVDEPNNAVRLIGPVSVNDVTSNYVLTLYTSPDLKIYDLSDADKEISNALDEVLTEPGNVTLELNRHIELSNPDEIMYKIIQKRLDDLTSNSNDPAVRKEINYLNGVLKDPQGIKPIPLAKDLDETTRTLTFDIIIAGINGNNGYKITGECQVRGLTTPVIELAVSESVESGKFAVSPSETVVVDGQTIIVDTNANLKAEHTEHFGK